MVLLSQKLRQVIRTCIVLFFVALPAPTVLATFNVLHSFSESDGSLPSGPVTLVGSTLYGLTQDGGQYGNGVLYAVDIDGSNFTVLHDFQYSVSGAFPSYGLTAYGNKLYGFTYDGGSNTAGVIFSYDTLLNTFSVHYSFSGSEGGAIYSSPVFSGSTLYGVGYSGGTSGVGVVFSYDTFGGTYSILHEFNWTNGAFPRGELTLSGTTLYGVTSGGGVANQGVIYKVNTDGSGFAVLHAFTNTASPHSGLKLVGNTLYGMALGGAYSHGQIYSIGTDGSNFTVIHDFDYYGGSTPYGSFALSGNTLYGMTQNGGTNDYGVVFSINADGTGFTVLHEFAGGAGGRYPMFGSPLVVGTNLYGTTSSGGVNNEGIVFSLVIPEPSTVGLLIVGAAWIVFARRARSCNGA
jgi:uncharacterized repeat protein (TIGR03803 family)